MTTLKQSHRRITQVPIMETATLDIVKSHVENSDKMKVLVLPALYREFQKSDGAQSAMEGILPVLKNADYIDHIVLGLDGANKDQYQEVLSLMKKADLPQKLHVLWNDGPEIANWRESLASQDHDNRPLAPNKKGKGRNVWGCAGYAKALMEQEGVAPENTIIAMHDTDIVTYDEFLVARLFQPMSLDQDNETKYVKGNYPRYTDEKLNGRVTRLFGPPLIDALARSIQDNPEYNTSGTRELVHFFRSFQYMFSGEMAFSGDMLNDIELPNDYSMEIRILEQVYSATNDTMPNAIMDVQLANRYDHHHQGMDGLEEMTTQIAAALFDIVNKKVELTAFDVNTIANKYANRGELLAKKFGRVAEMNGLSSNVDKEEKSVVTFSKTLLKALERVEAGLEKPSHSWSMISHVAPDATTNLYKAVLRSGGILEKDIATVHGANDNTANAPGFISKLTR